MTEFEEMDALNDQKIQRSSRSNSNLLYDLLLLIRQKPSKNKDMERYARQSGDTCGK